MKTRFVALSLALIITGCSAHAEQAVRVPTAAYDPADTRAQAVAVLAGGCFWGVEAVFEQVKGVKSVVSGYAGGAASDANYEAVSAETTKHAEAVRITYDPRLVSYGTLLRIYFSVAHDPTQLNRQGPDTGPSYRSAIFPVTPAQNAVARAYLTQLTKAGSYPRPIVTKLESGKFYDAESYHQDFMRRNPKHPYIVRWDAPKLKALRAAYPALTR